MANSYVQLLVENWIRTEWLPGIYSQPFIPRRLRLNTGGYFDFDAVSEDRRILANISTSNAKTASGKNAMGKIQKLRSDMLFLLMVPDVTRLIILSESDMFTLCQKEKNNGRIPNEISFLHAEIPEDYKRLLTDAKKIASVEVSPREV